MKSIARLRGVEKQNTKLMASRLRKRKSTRSLSVTKSNKHILLQRVRTATNSLPSTSCYLDASEVIGSLVESAAIGVSERKLCLH